MEFFSSLSKDDKTQNLHWNETTSISPSYTIVHINNKLSVVYILLFLWLVLVLCWRILARSLAQNHHELILHIGGICVVVSLSTGFHFLQIYKVEIEVCKPRDGCIMVIRHCSNHGINFTLNCEACKPIQQVICWKTCLLQWYIAWLSAITFLTCNSNIS